MQHFVDICLGLKFFQDVHKVWREDFLLSLYCPWPLQQWMNINLYWSPKQTTKEKFSWKISLQHVLEFYISSRSPSSNGTTALISSLLQLVTIGDENSDIISYSKHMFFQPKGSKCALPICVAITITPWLWNSYLKAQGNLGGSTKKRTAQFCFGVVVLMRWRRDVSERWKGILKY